LLLLALLVIKYIILGNFFLKKTLIQNCSNDDIKEYFKHENKIAFKESDMFLSLINNEDNKI
jgi:hypothetical protein